VFGFCLAEVRFLVLARIWRVFRVVATMMAAARAEHRATEEALGAEKRVGGPRWEAWTLLTRRTLYATPPSVVEQLFACGTDSYGRAAFVWRLVVGGG
jgi:hypothetical protein